MTLARRTELGALARLCLRLGLFAVLLAAAQWALAHLAGLHLPGAFVKDLAAVDEVRDGDVVYFGDSVLLAVSPRDVDRRGLPEMVAGRLAPLRVAAVAHAACQPLVFDAAAEHLLRSGRRPRAFVVPINLRSFCPPWAGRPSWQFTRERALLRMSPGLGDAFMRVRIAYKQIPPAEPDPGAEVLWKQADLPALRARFPALAPEAPLGRYPSATDFTRMYYLTPSGREHPYTQALAALGARAERAGIPIVFYVTPVDVQTASADLGQPFYDELAAKGRAFETLLTPLGASFRDWSTVLAPADFMWVDDGGINEHLGERGRRHLARLVAGEVRGLLQVPDASAARRSSRRSESGSARSGS